MKRRHGFHPPETEFTWGEGKGKNTYMNYVIPVPGYTAPLRQLRQRSGKSVLVRASEDFQEILPRIPKRTGTAENNYTINKWAFT